jgi:hypothetical protein
MKAKYGPCSAVKYLPARAEFLEAENPLQIWSQRFAERKTKLAGLPEPRLERKVVLLKERKEVACPAGAIAVSRTPCP